MGNLKVQPLPVVLVAVIALLLFSNWRTARDLKREHGLRISVAAKIEQSLLFCQPAVILDHSTNPVDAVPSMRYRENASGHGCVFITKDARYGNLWWTIVTEGKHKAHLEWNFEELGHYKW